MENEWTEEVDHLRAVNKQLLEALDTLTIYAEAIQLRVDLENETELTNIYAASMPELKAAIRQAKKAIKIAEGGSHENHEKEPDKNYSQAMIALMQRIAAEAKKAAEGGRK